MIEKLLIIDFRKCIVILDSSVVHVSFKHFFILNCFSLMRIIIFFFKTYFMIDRSCRYAAHTLTSKSLVLVTIKIINDDSLEICVNCEKMVIGSMLMNELKNNLR